MEKRISGTTTLLALIGSPVGHSGSPAMHNYSFEKLGLDYAYMAFEIKEDQVGEFLDAARLLKIRGFNVTMPCKMEVARQVDELSPAAQIMGASNTVVNENGKLIGHNTDGVGFVKNLAEHGVSVKELHLWAVVEPELQFLYSLHWTELPRFMCLTEREQTSKSLRRLRRKY